MRIGKSVLFKCISIILFLHLECAFASFKRARVESSVITSADDVDGMNDLSEDDMIRVISLINELTSVARNLTKDSKVTTDAHRFSIVKCSNAHRKLKTKQAPSELPKFKVMYTNAIFILAHTTPEQ